MNQRKAEKDEIIFNARIDHFILQLLYTIEQAVRSQYVSNNGYITFIYIFFIVPLIFYSYYNYALLRLNIDEEFSSSSFWLFSFFPFQHNARMCVL